MFDISFSELLVIGVVALVVIGPERLPKTARTLGHLFGRLQRYVTEVKADISREMELDELRKLQQQVNTAAQEIQSGVTTAVAEAQAGLRSTEAELAGITAGAAAATPAASGSPPAANAAETPAAPGPSMAIPGAESVASVAPGPAAAVDSPRQAPLPGFERP